MFNSHVIILPFHFPVEIIEMNIIFDITVAVPEYKCNHSSAYPAENVILSQCVFQIKDAQRQNALCVLKIDNAKLAAEDFRLK